MIENILFEVCFIYLKNGKNSGYRLHAENAIGQHQIWDEEIKKNCRWAKVV